MHRLINWKPRQFATPWTLCGMRRSLTVESRRRTCTAKHSGKCLEAISCSLSPSCLCLVRQTEGWLLDFFSSLSISGFLCTVYSLYPIFRSLSPCSLPYLLAHISPCPHITPVQKTAAHLNSSHPFLFVFASVLSRSLPCCDRLRSD